LAEHEAGFVTKPTLAMRGEPRPIHITLIAKLSKFITL
jgi:hypothetical protein